jgi:hypothetical protein
MGTVTQLRRSTKRNTGIGPFELTLSVAIVFSVMVMLWFLLLKAVGI